MPERKAIVQNDSTLESSSPSEQTESSDSYNQPRGSTHRLSSSEAAERGREGGRDSPAGSNCSDNSARLETEPRMLCHEELYGQVCPESLGEEALVPASPDVAGLPCFSSAPLMRHVLNEVAARCLDGVVAPHHHPILPASAPSSLRNVAWHDENFMLSRLIMKLLDPRWRL